MTFRNIQTVIPILFVVFQLILKRNIYNDTKDYSLLLVWAKSIA